MTVNLDKNKQQAKLAVTDEGLRFPGAHSVENLAQGTLKKTGLVPFHNNHRQDDKPAYVVNVNGHSDGIDAAVDHRMANRPVQVNLQTSGSHIVRVADDAQGVKVTMRDEGQFPATMTLRGGSRFFNEVNVSDCEHATEWSYSYTRTLERPSPQGTGVTVVMETKNASRPASEHNRAQFVAQDYLKDVQRYTGSETVPYDYLMTEKNPAARASECQEKLCEAAGRVAQQGAQLRAEELRGQGRGR